MAENFKTYFLDILSILIPGFLLLIVLGISSNKMNIFVYDFHLGDHKWMVEAAFIGIAYTVGHFVYFFGSYLDDWVYERITRRTSQNTLLQKVSDDFKILTTFKWSCAWLLANKPEMYAMVERHVAESKFFRSLSVVFFISFILFVVLGKFDIACYCIILFLLSQVRYFTQRKKSIETAYHYIITSIKRMKDGNPAVM